MIKNTQAILAAVMAVATLNTAAHAQSPMVSPNPAKNVVLVHGAFADGFYATDAVILAVQIN